MSYLAGEAIDEAAVLLNDPTQLLFTDDKLLPYLKKAFEELQMEMQDNDIPILSETNSTSTVTAGITTLNPPADLVAPIKLEEKAYNSSEVFIPMYEKTWEPSRTPTTRLVYWAWRKQVFYFVGATQSNTVKIYYYRSLTVPTSSLSAIEIPNSRTFLAARTAALAAAFSGEQPTKAAALATDAENALNLFLSIQVRGRQSLPTRRKPPIRSINRIWSR